MKKNGKKKSRGFRNAAQPPPRPRANAMPTTDRDTPAWRTLKALGGSTLAAVGCALIAREKLLPPKLATVTMSGIGATLALAAHSPTAREMGLGAASAASAQLALLVLDDHYRETAQVTGAKTAIVTTAPRPANLDGLPPGALEAAYDRARARLAMTSAS
jgi:hypothetical protein